jgi:hypothetical protein
MDKESQEHLALMLRGQRIAALGTLRDGAPLVTMVLFAAAPYFQVFYLHTSRLSHHTQDVLMDKRTSLMISELSFNPLEDPQLLRRISLVGETEIVPKDSLEYADAQTLYLDKYPQLDYNFQMGDFDFFRFRPLRARYVAGFAKAFNLEPQDLKRIAFNL